MALMLLVSRRVWHGDSYSAMTWPVSSPWWPATAQAGAFKIGLCRATTFWPGRAMPPL